MYTPDERKSEKQEDKFRWAKIGESTKDEKQRLRRSRPTKKKEEKRKMRK